MISRQDQFLRKSACEYALGGVGMTEAKHELDLGTLASKATCAPSSHLRFVPPF